MMWWLIFGVLLWSVVHLSVSLTPGVRAGLIDRIGEGPYKGLYSVLIIASLALLVLGWRASARHAVYTPPQWGYYLAIVLMIPALILFFASNFRTNIKRLLRHPQLTGFALWAAAHLLSNGDSRSLVLFGGLALWAILQILVINRREGTWHRPPAVPFARDLAPAAIGITVFALLLWLHPYLAGRPVL